MVMEEQDVNTSKLSEGLESYSPKRHWLAISFTVLGTLVIVGVGYFSFTQHRQVNSLKSENVSLSAKNNQLTKSNKDLTAKNSTLQKSIQALSNPKKQSSMSNSTTTSLASTGSSTTSRAAPGALLTITSVQMLTPAYFGNTAPNASTDPVKVVFVTMKNLSSASQNYWVGEFTATTDTGMIVKPRVYAGPGMGTIWNNSTLASGGSTTQPLLFEANDNIVTLQWAPSGSSPISLAIPPITNN